MIARIPLYYTFRNFNRPRLLPINLTVSVTYNCNSRCMTCNIWKKKADEFTLEEFDKTFKTINKPYWVTMSGGEPFLRKDLTEIVKSLYDSTKPKIINIPTNGTIPGIAGKVRDMASYCGKSSLIVNLSIDGVGKKHDEIRGLDGCFERAMGTYGDLRKLKNKNFTLGIHTVISKYNVNDIPDIFSYVKELRPDSYITEMAEERAELGTVGSGISPSPGDYSRAVDFLSSRIKEERFGGISKITQAFRLEYYRLAKRILMEKRQAIPCYAGFTSGQISPDGDVWACCVRAESMGSLRENDYDFKRVWLSAKADGIRKKIAGKECHCPLANAAYTNMLMHPPAVLRVMKRVVS